jgi:hypothetical protein
MAKLEQVGEQHGWRCWLCDEPVDPTIVNDPRGPSIDTVLTKAKSKKTGITEERLAHRGCNTKKGAITPIVKWPDHLFLSDPAPILTSVDRLERKGGKEIMARCPSKSDAQEAADWLLDRLSRLRPDWPVSTEVEAASGQFLLVLRASGD